MKSDKKNFFKDKILEIFAQFFSHIQRGFKKTTRFLGKRGSIKSAKFRNNNRDDTDSNENIFRRNFKLLILKECSFQSNLKTLLPPFFIYSLSSKILKMASYKSTA